MSRVFDWPSALCAVGIMAGVGAMGWGGWESGLVGDNPRALSAKAVGKAARQEAVIALARTPGAQACLPVAQEVPEVRGLPGIEYANVPGQHALTYLVRVSDRTQPARQAQLAQMNHLASLGFFDVGDVSVPTNDGEKPGIRYRLTWLGYQELNWGSDAGLCLPLGRQEVVRISTPKSTDDRVVGLPVYQVKVIIRRTGTPDWVVDKVAQQLFPALANILAEQTVEARVIRTAQGWQSLHVAQMEAQAGSSGMSRGELFNSAETLLRPPVLPTLAEAETALKQREPASAVACIPLHLQYGGDDKTPRRADLPFSYTIYDLPGRKPYQLNTVLPSLHVLAALESVGLAQREVLTPLALRPAGSMGTDVHAGVRYTLPVNVLSALSLESGYGGCLPLGSVAMELLALHPQQYRRPPLLLVRGRLQQTPRWAGALAQQLPAVKSLLDHGLAYDASFVSGGGLGQEGAWHMSPLQPHYPRLRYATLPAHLVPLLPYTAAAISPALLVRAPGLIQPDVRAESGAIQAARRAAAQSTAQVQAAAIRQHVAAAPEKKPAPPYLAPEDSPVHVISVSGDVSSDSAKSGESVLARVNVHIAVPNASLLLLSYRPVQWRIHASQPVRQVIAAAVEDGTRVDYNGSGRPLVVTLNQSELELRAGLRRSPSIGQAADRNHLLAAKEWTMAVMGRQPAAVQVPQVAGQIVSINATTPPYALPTARALPVRAGVIALRGDEVGVQGTTLRRGRSGAYSEAFSDEAFAAGQGYFEATMRVTGSLSAHTHANVGMCLANKQYIEYPISGAGMAMLHGEQRLYQDGDVFGFAVDLDRHRMYVRVNGRWVNGEPGSNAGVPLEPDKEYRVCAFAAGTTTGDVQRGGKPQSDTGWELNFGSQPFRTAPPARFMPFQGS